MDEESSTEQKTETCFQVTLRGFLSERKRKVIPCRWTKTRKGTNCRESGSRNLKAEIISIIKNNEGSIQDK